MATQLKHSFLTQTKTLWSLFILTLLNTAAFVWISNTWDMSFLDGISSPDTVREMLAAYTPVQKTVHVWTTAVIDVTYPLVYGGLFAGVALRFFEKYGFLLALPALLAIPVDLFEGVIQVMALTETADWVDMKAVITPLKSNLFLIGFAVAVAGWVKWLIARVRR